MTATYVIGSPPLRPVAGARYGDRVVLGIAPPAAHNQSRVRVRCDCGVENIVYVTALRRGSADRCMRCARRRRGDAPPKPMPRLEPVPCLDPCLNGPRRPCELSVCRMWLGAHQESCALDVAAEGEHTLREIADLLGYTSERVRQIEAEALRKLAHRPAAHAVWEAMRMQRHWNGTEVRFRGGRGLLGMPRTRQRAVEGWR